MFIFIRGQGAGDPAQITKDGSVGLYVDGFYISRALVTTFDLADVDRVEVLRGPQGTLYGRNTTGGAVNIITKKPSGEFGFKQQLTAGNYNAFRSLTTVDLPAWNGFSTKFSYVKSSRDGFVDNLDKASHDYNESEQHAGRVAVNWKNDSGFSVDYAYERGNLTSTPQYYQNSLNLNLIPGYNLDRFKTYRPVNLPDSPASYTQNSLTLAWDVTPDLTLRSLTGYRRTNITFFQDYNESFNFNAGTAASPVLFPLGFQSYDVVHAKQFTQEFQAVGSALDSQLKYTAGLYYFKEDANHLEIVSVQIPAFGVDDPGDPRYVVAESKSKAAYAQVTYTPPILDSKLDITVGARYTKDDRTASKTDPRSVGIVPVSLSADFTRFNPAASVSYRWSDELMTYVRYATGYRAGGFSESSPNFQRGFGPEKIKSYEFGFKSDLFDRRVRLNVALFRADFTDMQLDLSPNANDLTQTDTFNAGKAKIDGAEVDLTVSVLQGLTLTANYVYMHPTVDFVNADLSPFLQAKYGVGGNAKRTFALGYVPTGNYSVGLDYVLPHFSWDGGGDIYLHLDLDHHSDFLGSSTSGPDVPYGSAFATPASTLLNARVGYDFTLANGSKLQTSLWSKNVTDKDWYSHAIGNGDLRGYYGKALSRGWPRTFGIDLTYQY